MDSSSMTDQLCPEGLASRPRANSRTDNLLHFINMVAPPEHIWRCGRLCGLSTEDTISNPHATRIVVLLKTITGLLASSGITLPLPRLRSWWWITGRQWPLIDTILSTIAMRLQSKAEGRNQQDLLLARMQRGSHTSILRKRCP